MPVCFFVAGEEARGVEEGHEEGFDDEEGDACCEEGVGGVFCHVGWR